MKNKLSVKVYVAGFVVVALLGALAPKLLATQFWLSAPALPEPPLKTLAADHGVALGVLTYPKHLQSRAFTSVLNSQYSMITSDGDIHWDTFRPSPTEYNFKAMDTMVAYAGAHDMTVQAHHLVWDEDDSLPEWLKQGNYSQAELLNFMHDHIRTVVGRYKGKVAEWSVVNEPFTRAKHVYGLDNWWSSHLGGGTNYIDQAFIWARQADPTAKLILNDFNNETENDISNTQYNYMKAAKARGVPIDGIGMQIHVDAANPPSKAAMVKNMQRFGALGYKVYITEFDISSTTVAGSNEYKANREAWITNDVARACIESKSCVSFTVFGMTDIKNRTTFTHAKQRSNLLSPDYQPKPAFYALRSAWLQP